MIKNKKLTKILFAIVSSLIVCSYIGQPATSIRIKKVEALTIDTYSSGLATRPRVSGWSPLLFNDKPNLRPLGRAGT